MTDGEARVDLRRQLLTAALACAGDDLGNAFTFEQLLVEAWKRSPQAFGLRGFERLYPDSERLHRELDSRGKTHAGLVGQGLLQKVKPRVYRLTPEGMDMAARNPDASDPAARDRVDRRLEAEISRLLSAAAFIKWLRDPSEPRSFRDACQFWRIAPGTPPAVIKSRIVGVDAIVRAARDVLARSGSDEVMAGRGGNLLFSEEDLERCSDFQQAMLDRFADDLKVLGVRMTE